LPLVTQLAFWLFVTRSAAARLRSSSSAMKAVRAIIIMSVASVEKALMVPTKSFVFSPRYISTEISRK